MYLSIKKNNEKSHDSSPLSLDVTVLADHLKNCAKNASYQSKTIQNDIFEMLGV